MRRILAALVLSTVLVACAGSSDEDTPVAQPGATATSDEVGPDQGGKNSRDGDKRGSARGEGRSEARGNGSSSGGAPEPNDDDGGSSAGTGRSARRTGPPVAGTYTYAQEGWEEICQAGACDRSDLPPEQRLAVEHQTTDGSTFSTTTRGAGAREQSITYSLGNDRLLIRRISNDFQYGAFRTRSEIVPDPPILTARLPFRVGNSWKGRWSDRGGEIDGSYAFRVRGREPMRGQEAFVVDMTMTFRGTYRGSSDLRLWVDPRDVTILASRGRTEITGEFGTYRTKGTTSLVGRP